MPMGSTYAPVPPAVNVQPSPQTVCQTHLELICNVDTFLPQRAGHGVQPIADRVFFVIGPLPSPILLEFSPVAEPRESDFPQPQAEPRQGSHLAQTLGFHPRPSVSLSR